MTTEENNSRWRLRTRPARGDAKGLVRVSDSATLSSYLSDAAHYPGGSTTALYRPESEAAVGEVLVSGGTVMAVGAQSSLTGGATPNGETLLSTERMAAIGAWEGTTVTVGPGLVLARLEPELSERGKYYPPVPTFDGATVGGTVATNAAGAATFKYGTTRDWVEGLSLVLANGEVLDIERGLTFASDEGHFEIETGAGSVIRVPLPSYTMPDVPKHSAGYFVRPGMDLIDLVIGAEGTLGVVTSVSLRLAVPRPEWFVALLPMGDEAAALALNAELREASRSGQLDVAAIEYMDRRSLELAAEHDRVRLAPLPTGAGTALLVQAELPAGTSRDQAAAELAEAGGSPLAGLGHVLREHGVFDEAAVALPGEDARRRALFAVREAVPEAVNGRVAEVRRDGNPGVSKAASDVIVPFDKLTEAMTAYRAAMSERGLDHAVWGHVSDGNLHPNMIATNDAEMESARDCQLELGRIAIRLGGSPMSEHGTGRNPVKQVLLGELYGKRGMAEMRAVKDAFDPHGVLSPGVMLPAAGRTSE